MSLFQDPTIDNKAALNHFGEFCQEFEGGEEASLASFFRHLSVGGVARPVDTLLMAGLILYGSRPFEKAVQSKTKQLAYVFQVHLPGNSQQPCQYPPGYLSLASSNKN